MVRVAISVKSGHLTSPSHDPSKRARRTPIDARPRYSLADQVRDRPPRPRPPLVLSPAPAGPPVSCAAPVLSVLEPIAEPVPPKVVPVPSEPVERVVPPTLPWLRVLSPLKPVGLPPPLWIDVPALEPVPPSVSRLLRQLSNSCSN